MQTAGPPKTVCYLSLPGDSEVYPVTSLHLYLSKTQDQVSEMRQPKPVFVTFRKSYRRACPGILGHWTRGILQRQGLILIISQPIQPEVQVPHRLKVANWSCRKTFECYYDGSQLSPVFTRAVLQPEQSSRYVCK